MQELELGTSGWILEAKVAPIDRGLLRGAIAVQITMAGARASGSFDEVFSLVKQLKTLQLPKRKIVRFSGTFSSDDKNFTLLLTSLRDYGFELQAIIAGDEAFPWLSLVSWMIIKTTEPTVLLAADEIWMTLEDLSKDATIPVKQGGRSSAYYLISGRKGFSYEEMLDFICTSHYPWWIGF